MSLNLSENYYLRKCLLENDQVPTQSQILQKMQEPLGKVYFDSMTYKMKVIAGLEPPMRGGGSDWYMPPDELLKGKAILKPIEHEYISKLGYKGIEFYSDKIIEEYHMSLAKERTERLKQNDKEWKNKITCICLQLWDELSLEAAQRNTKLIVEAFHQYTSLYATNLNRVEHLLLQAARKEIEDNRERAYQKMIAHYEKLLKDQASMLYSRYTKALEKQKEDRKTKFVSQVEELRMDLAKEYHKINYEKHVTIEKFKAYMECQNLACQMYVAMKEQQEHEKEVSDIKEKHRKKMRSLKKELTKTEYDLKLEQKLDDNRQELNRIWRKKICKVVKSFQDFIGYCLKSMPEHAEFFLDIEKLLLLQMDEAFDNPDAESIIVSEDDGIKTPVPRPHPYYLICDRGFKPKIDADLCPKHCTSSASQLPVVIVNKRCIYSACDNLALFAEKLEEYIKGKDGEESDIEDDHSYTNDIPIKYSRSQNIKELKLESSLMQIMQNEIPNLNDLPVYCCDCHLPHCYLPSEVKEKACPVRARSDPTGKSYSYAVLKDSTHSVEKVSRSAELKHEREPKVESYLDFVRPPICACYKMAKKHLKEHLPPYMVNTSMYAPPELPNYQTCSMETLRTLVREARGIHEAGAKVRPALEYNMKEVSTQCEDEDFEYLCSCYADSALETFFTELAEERAKQDRQTGFKIVDNEEVAKSDLEKSASLFAMEQALKLRKVVECPQIQEIFKRPDCQYFDK